MLRKKKLLEAIKMIKPTSKAALKQQCLYLSRLDVAKAEKMYDFLIKDVAQSIPDVEPESVPLIKNLKEQAGGVFNWLRENEDVLTKGAAYIKSIFQKSPVKPVEPLPPINP